ncbi:hypothetical protein [Methylomicrobium sp. Wu6]|uniref:hypothetical protein n=1 Tax=Methylomicrobium sp. Wu6 TaxID=3107928 RepID=UPI002DD63403|nr:hypothetical protein [Methylomicrobium sp. Wu6]MEC4749429.1 hypothetical protein [Methylomicrobium sp. Wu6]
MDNNLRIRFGPIDHGDFTEKRVVGTGLNLQTLKKQNGIGIFGKAALSDRR